MGLLVLGWVLYYMLHSALATTWVKDAVAALWPAAPRFYRLAYNQLSVWLFLLLFHYQLGLPATLLINPTPLLVGAGYVLLSVGVLLMMLAFRGYNLSEFAGWAYLRRGAAAADTGLNTAGFNGVVRHPLYLGILVGLGGFFLTSPTLPRLIFVGCTVAYVLVGTRLEERKLLLRFGEAYRRYRRHVPMLVPSLSRKAK
jgi:protein-S-isoprenylcysteine O-methyltransferase Ste14